MLAADPNEAARTRVRDHEVQLLVDPEVLRRLEQRLSQLERRSAAEPLAAVDLPHLPDRTDRYVIEHRLSHGGMAELFLARTQVTGVHKRVVVKTLLPSFAGDPAFVEMLVNEARIVGGLCHPNVVRVEDLVELDGRPFIVMEYVEGRNLRQIIARAARLGRTLSHAASCRIMSRVLAGLSHAHDQLDEQRHPLGIVHRDISPANVMVTWSGGVKHIDFGIAKATRVPSELTRLGELKGKSAYMSPEQVRCQPLDRRSDLFAAGIVLWELLTGWRLFRRDTDIDTLMAVCDAPVVPPSLLSPGLPGRLDEICNRALAHPREQRYPTADAMREDLESLLASEGWDRGRSAVRVEMSSLFPEAKRR